MNRRTPSTESLTSPEFNVRPAREATSTYTRSLLSRRIVDRWTIACLIIASVNILNGLWMIITPENWYHNLPAGVPEYGPLNVHFIRDLGCVFTLLGIGLISAGFDLSLRLPLFTMNTLFYLAHMLVHVHEVISGRVRMGMFWVDLPGVYFPAIIALILNIFLIRTTQTRKDG